jgi:hypothetical protein
VNYRDIAKGYIDTFKNDQEGFLRQVGMLSSIRGVLVQVYYELVKEKKCVRIEDLDPEEKQDLWQEAKRISGRTEKNYLKEVSKALHGFGSFLITTRQ